MYRVSLSLRKLRYYNGKCREIILTFSFTLQQSPLSDEHVGIQPETLRDAERYCQIFRAVKTDTICLFMSNYLFTPRT